MLDENSLYQLSKRLGVTQSAMANLVGNILAMATEMTGDEEEAVAWFKHQPIPGWAGKTAYDLVGEGEAPRVQEYLEAVRAGVYA